MRLLIIGILLLVIACGCVQTNTFEAQEPTMSALEDQAIGQIDQELEDAIKDTDTSELENEIIG